MTLHFFACENRRRSSEDFTEEEAKAVVARLVGNPYSARPIVGTHRWVVTQDFQGPTTVEVPDN